MKTLKLVVLSIISIKSHIFTKLNKNVLGVFDFKKRIKLEHLLNAGLKF